MILGGVDIYLTNVTTIYLPAYGLPVLLSFISFRFNDVILQHVDR